MYKKYTGHEVDPRVKEHGILLARVLADMYGLRREPAFKGTLGPGLFIYLAYFRLVRDRTAFNTGLDRLNDATIRIFQMYTAARTHELAYDSDQHPEDNRGRAAKEIAKYRDEEDAFADLERPHKSIQRRSNCWVCGGTDDRTLKVLCWEDICLLVLRNPLGDGKDRLAMEVLFRFHKGHNNEIRPTVFLFVEEDLPLICPVSNIVAKALAEDVIDMPAFSAAKLFITKLNLPVVHISWKRESWHVPAFRQSEWRPEKGFVPSALPVTRNQYDYRTNQLGQVAGLPGDLTSYDARRGQLQSLDGRFLLPRTRYNLTRRNSQPTDLRFETK